MATPRGAQEDADDEVYDELVEFQCPVCGTSVTDDDETCPGCGAIFVGEEDPDAPSTNNTGEVGDHLMVEGYELDEEMDYDELDDEAIEAELAAMEADLDEEPFEPDEGVADATDDYESPFEDEPIDLHLAYEEDLEVEEEVEEVFGAAVAVSADDHAALEEMSKPTLMERMFQRTGLGMFIAGGAASVILILWDPMHGQPLVLGTMQLRFLVLSLAMFIVGFAVEMFQAYSLTTEEELLRMEG